MLAKENPQCADRGEKDIGEYALTPGQSAHKSAVSGPLNLQRDNTRALDEIHEVIGSKQVTRSYLTFAPPWILRDALRSEHDTDWLDSYEEVKECDVPRTGNVINSHVVYKLKTEEDGNRKMKARIVPHGNRDNEKDEIRKDSSNASLFVVRLLLSLVTFLQFRIGTADIKGAFLQSGPIKRDIYVRPPREWNTIRGILWKLLKLPYGIADAGRQWQKVIEEWMLTQAGLERVFGIPQLFVKRDQNDHISLIVAKVTDDFLLGGTIRQMQMFIDDLQKRFIVGKVAIDGKIHFDGCEIQQDMQGNITMSMVRYLERLKPIVLSRERRKQRMEIATQTELKQYRSLACTLMYLGNSVLPQAAYATSALQQWIGRVNVERLVIANEMLKEILSLKPWVTFRQPPNAANIKEVLISSFSDASFNLSSSSGYGQTGVLTGFRIELHKGPDIFHPIDWCSNKQRRVSYSPYGAEILACADADDRGYYFKVGLNSIFMQASIRSELFTDSRCLYDTIATLHESKDFRLRATVQRIRNSFDSQELDFMKWIPGTINPVDALMKRNPETTKLLNEMISGGIVRIDLHSGFSLNSHTWQ